MSGLSFWRGGELLALIDDAQPGDMLLDVARFHEVPLHWRCGQGTCGTCAVRIRHAGQPRDVKVGRKERNVLLRAALVDAAQAAQEVWLDTESTPRLACHLPLEDMAWQVLLPDDN
ncbi:2Fe-2S iron-sulfur cluster-binding protein [Vogesella oryzae]|uniref:2Fe-2S iron-sulfur cluster-binding protein n=1 Tax=Vogesella oryzae TaxID=1735285 RepID=UPI0015822982|nr:2Fe-2S iron-sulfur cluster binding domain-containing protein [Vogesella oryzae]